MKIPFLSPILVSIIFQNPDSAAVEKPLSWTIPVPLTEYSNLQNRLEARGSATWINPIANGVAITNEVFTIGNVVDVQWTTDFDEYFVYLWQQDLVKEYAVADQDPIFTKSSDDVENGGFNWTASTETFSLSDSNVFYFSLGQNATLKGHIFTNHYFNLTEKATASTTSPNTTSKTASSMSSSSTTSKTTSSVSSTSVSSSTLAVGVTASPTTTTAVSAKDSSSSRNLVVGLVVGLGIPILLLLSALVYFKLRKPKNKALPSPSVSENSAQQMHLMQGPPPTTANPNGLSTFYDKNWKPAELHGNGVVGELDTTREISDLP